MLFIHNPEGDIWGLETIKQAYQDFLAKKMALDFLELDDPGKKLVGEYIALIESIFSMVITGLSPATPPSFPFFESTPHSQEKVIVSYYKSHTEAPKRFDREHADLSNIIKFENGQFIVSPLDSLQTDQSSHSSTTQNTARSAPPPCSFKSFEVSTRTFNKGLITPSPELQAEYMRVVNCPATNYILTLDEAFPNADSAGSSTSLDRFANLATQLFQDELHHEIAKKLGHLKICEMKISNAGLNLQALPLASQSSRSVSYQFMSTEECSRIFFRDGYFIALSCTDTIQRLKSLLKECEESLNKLAHTGAYIKGLTDNLFKKKAEEPPTLQAVEMVVVDIINKMAGVYLLSDMDSPERSKLFLSFLLFSESIFLALSRDRIKDIPSTFRTIADNLKSVQQRERAQTIFDSCCKTAIQERTQSTPPTASTDLSVPSTLPTLCALQASVVDIATRVPPKQATELLKSLTSLSGLFSHRGQHGVESPLLALESPAPEGDSATATASASSSSQA